MSDTPTISVDGIRAMEIRHGVARIMFVRANAEAKLVDAVELSIPAEKLESIWRALAARSPREATRNE